MKIKCEENKVEKETRNFQKLWDTFKRCNILHDWNTKWRRNGVKEIFEVTMAMNFPKLFTKPEIQETQGKPRNTNTKTNIYREFFKLTGTFLNNNGQES